MLHQIAKTAILRVTRNGIRSSSHEASNFRPAHMNEIPIPQGSWQKSYDQKQKVYNTQLAVGLATLIGTIAWMVNSDLIFLNAFAPKRKQN